MIIEQTDEYPIMRTLAEANPDPIVDVASATVTYYGYAPLGTPLTSPLWKIKKENKVGNVTTTEDADGDMKYDNIWSNRATLVYTR